MAEPEKKEAGVDELKLHLSRERASWGLLCDDPAASPEDRERVAARIQNLEAQLAVLGADLHTPLADDVAPGSGVQPSLAAPDSPELEQCKAAILALAESDRHQLVLWIARGMPKD